MAKNVLKFAGGFGALLILGLALFYGFQYYQYRQNPEFKAMKEFENLKRLYEQDTYGGTTPEETLQLFIDALKKGDIELASKYFLPDEWEKWEKELAQIKEGGFLNAMIEDLQKTKLSLTEDEAFFSLIDERNIVISELIMRKNSTNSLWKILEL